MKTLEIVAKEKNRLLTELGNLTNDQKTDIRAITKKLGFVKTIESYLKTEPSEEFLQKEYARLTNRLNKIIEGEPKKPESELTGFIEAWKKKKAEYNKLMGVSDLKNKLNTLRYVLN